MNRRFVPGNPQLPSSVEVNQSQKDDALSMAWIAVVAYIVADLLHEGIGHGVTAWLSGARRITLSTVALQSDIATRWISANGALVNLAAAGILWLVLQKARPKNPAAYDFLLLAMAANLFSGTGYFLFSGVTDFGDWAEVIRGLAPHWAWRTGLIVTGAATYYAAMLVVGRELARFRESPGRLRRLCWIPYFSQAALAAAAGVFNPAGLFYVVASALPSTLGANAGLLSLPFMMHGWRHTGEYGPIRRSVRSIAAGAIAAALFIVVLGRGVSWSR
jgi:hypothetical protein